MLPTDGFCIVCNDRRAESGIVCAACRERRVADGLRLVNEAIDLAETGSIGYDEVAAAALRGLQRRLRRERGQT